jgi:ribonuclease HI
MHHPSSYHIDYTDGASRWTQNIASTNWALYTPSHMPIHFIGICLGLVTNNQAKYDVAIGILIEAIQCHIRHLSVLLDSQLFILGLNNVYHVHNPFLFRKYLQVRLLYCNFDSITFTHISRNLNQVVDHMANLVLDWNLSH